MSLRSMQLPFAPLIVLVPSVVAQTTWYVDVHATPPGNGTPGSPYTDLQAAHDASTTVDSDTLLVAPGSYAGPFLFTKRVTFRATGGPEVTTLVPGSASDAILTLSGPLDELGVLVMEGFTITGHAGGTRGAVYSFEGRLVRCVVRGNAGVGVETGYDTDLFDCTVAGNGAGVECNTLSDAIWMRNCIVWGNGTNCFMQIPPIGVDVRYCAGGPFPFASGPGNLGGDPGMWDVTGGDFHLKPGSPCIDAGDPALLDPDGSRSDIGYFTYDSGYVPMTTYCVGKLNSHGCIPGIAGSGLPSLTNPAPFFITATLVPPGKRGVLFYSHTQDAQPFEGGTFCIGAFRRAGGQTSQGSGACGGLFSYNFNLRIQSGADPTLFPGEVIYAQWWHRDPNDPAGYQSGLTNALCFGIAP
ncbi:MAG: hypothetical protein IPJ77_14325 [Planctomycetes bacterium]|nr:hypothetical protein [Planctomycetota bacterium]